MKAVPLALPSGRVIDLCDVVVATPPHVTKVMLRIDTTRVAARWPYEYLSPDDGAAALAALHALPEDLALDEFSEDA